MSVKRWELPYEKNALEPFISRRTIEFHYDKHHAAYEAKANELLEGTFLQDEPLETIMRMTVEDPIRAVLYNNAAQVWNHSFSWRCMKPGGGGIPGGHIAELIDESFGGFEPFVEQFTSESLARFGSGWAWLVMRDEKLKIMTTANADSPVARGIHTLFTVDLWEHAYYLDYQNRRGDYLDALLRNLVDWDFVNGRLGG